MRKPIFLLLFLLLPAALSAAEGTTAITNATIIPVTADTIRGGTVLIENGKIAAVGIDVAVPEDAQVIDATGLYVYPGLIDAYSKLGLTEIGAIRASRDDIEMGDFNPELEAAVAINAHSVHIPITRTNGITHALVAPQGSVISGQSAFIKLDGWTWEEMVVRTPMALQISFPTSAASRRASEEQRQRLKKRATERMELLEKKFDEARRYHKRKAAAAADPKIPAPAADPKLEAMIPVLEKKLPVMILVERADDIKRAIDFVEEQELVAILRGCREGWKVAEEIATAGIPVILSPTFASPYNFEDGYDAPYRNAAELVRAGVKIAFSSGHAALAKLLPHYAAKAAAFGLSREDALKAVTLNAAEILGLADTYGSIEVGKSASLIVVDNDPLEIISHVRHAFIEGVPVDLSNKHRKLYEKFRKRPVKQRVVATKESEE